MRVAKTFVLGLAIGSLGFSAQGVAADQELALAELQKSILVGLWSDCTVPEKLRFEEGAIVSRPGDRIEVHLGLVSCPRWEFNHPFCGARLCGVNTYRLTDAGYALEKEELR